MRRDNAAWIPLLLFLAGASLVLAGLLELPAAIFHPAAAGLGLAVAVRVLNLLILGAGGHGEIVRELARSLNVFHRIAFLDDDPDNPRAIGKCEKLGHYVREYPIAIPSVGDQKLRMRWLGELAAAGFVLPVLIHPTAVVSANVPLGYGTVVEARATIGPGAVIGRGCIISSGATIDRGVSIPDWTLIDCGQVVRNGQREA